MIPPKVTVITVTYNLIKNARKEYFRQCLESVNNQTYKNVEHIVIDGASNDGTVDLLNEYTNIGWITYISEPDSGIYEAMNKGILKATGKYIAFLNSDDFWHDSHGIEESVKILEENNADFSYADALFLRRDKTLWKLNARIETFFMRIPFCHQTMFTKTELLRKNLFNEKYKGAADYDLIVRLCLKACKPVFVRSIFTTYRECGFSTTNVELSDIEVIDVLYELLSKLSSHLTIDDCRQMHFKNLINEDLFGVIKSVVHPEILDKINNLKTMRNGAKIKIRHLRYVTPLRLIDRLRSSFSKKLEKIIRLATKTLQNPG